MKVFHIREKSDDNCRDRRWVFKSEHVSPMPDHAKVIIITTKHNIYSKFNAYSFTALRTVIILLIQYTRWVYNSTTSTSICRTDRSLKEYDQLLIRSVYYFRCLSVTRDYSRAFFLSSNIYYIREKKIFVMKH